MEQIAQFYATQSKWMTEIPIKYFIDILHEKLNKIGLMLRSCFSPTFQGKISVMAFGRNILNLVFLYKQNWTYVAPLFQSYIAGNKLCYGFWQKYTQLGFLYIFFNKETKFVLTSCHITIIFLPEVYKAEIYTTFCFHSDLSINVFIVNTSFSVLKPLQHPNWLFFKMLFSLIRHKNLLFRRRLNSLQRELLCRISYLDFYFS